MHRMYQGRCANCGHRTPEISDESALAVYLDDPIGSPGLSDDDRIVFLQHLSDTLAENGYTLWSATIQGRLFWHTSRICTACGQHYGVRKLGSLSGCSGFASAAVVGFASGVFYGIWSSSFLHGFFVALTVTCFAILPMEACLHAWVRMRYASRARKLDRGRCCPKCGSRRAVSPMRPGFRRVKLPCSRCGTRSVTYKVTAECIY